MFLLHLLPLWVLALQAAATPSSNNADVRADPAASIAIDGAATKEEAQLVGNETSGLHNLELRSSCASVGCPDGYLCYSYCGCVSGSAVVVHL